MASRPDFTVPDLPQYVPESSELARDNEVAQTRHAQMPVSCAPCLSARTAS